MLTFIYLNVYLKCKAFLQKKKKKILNAKLANKLIIAAHFSKKNKIIIQPYNLGRRGKLIK